MSSLYILDINSLLVVSFASIFSHSVGCLFILSLASLAEQKLLSLIRSHLFIFRDGRISFILKVCFLLPYKKFCIIVFLALSLFWYHVVPISGAGSDRHSNRNPLWSLSLPTFIITNSSLRWRWWIMSLCCLSPTSPSPDPQHQPALEFTLFLNYRLSKSDKISKV